MRRTTTPGAEPGRPAGTDRLEECLNRPRDPLPTRVEGLPELPAAYDAALDAGLRDLGLTLPGPARLAIADHVRLLLAWNQAINLTAIREPAEIALRHVVDSLAAVEILRRRGIDAFVDLGSGGGFPGLPLAAAIPAIQALLVDSGGKKATLLVAAAEASGLSGSVDVGALRAEDLARDRAHRERWPAVLARAIGSLGELVELAFPLLRRDGILVAWKGPALDREFAGARRAIDAAGGGFLETLEVDVRGLEDHRLVVVAKGGRTPDALPRDPSARRRAPW